MLKKMFLYRNGISKLVYSSYSIEENSYTCVSRNQPGFEKMKAHVGKIWRSNTVLWGKFRCSLWNSFLHAHISCQPAVGQAHKSANASLRAVVNWKMGRGDTKGWIKMSSRPSRAEGDDKELRLLQNRTDEAKLVGPGATNQFYHLRLQIFTVNCTISGSCLL